MRWNRPFISGNPDQGWCIIRIVGRNTCQFATPSAWRRQALSPLWAASATATTTRSPKRSTACSRPRSFTDVAHGAASTPWNTPPSNGSTGSTTAACWNPSGISRQQRPRQTITQLWKDQTWPRNLDKSASGKPGTVHTSDDDGDFTVPANGSFTMPVSGRAQLAVMKKVTSRLNSFHRTIERTPPTILRNLKVLLIDDECDQASVNSSRDDYDMTKINEAIRKIINSLPAVSYVGYTATPFA